MQTTINVAQAFGLVGEMYDTTPRRVDAKEIATAFTLGGVAGAKPADGTVGTMDASTYTKFVGIFVRPKEAINYGLTTVEGGVGSHEALAASLTQPAGVTAQIVRMGRVNVLIPAAETNGWKPNADLYVTAAGALTTTAGSNTKIGVVIVGGAAKEVACIQVG